MQTGQGLVGLVLSLINFSILVYYNVIQSTPILNEWFNTFLFFLGVALAVIPALFMVVGYWYKKKSPFFKAQRDIDIEVDPYTSFSLTPVALKWVKVLVEVAKKNDVDTAELDRLVVESEVYNASGRREK